jgi:putative transposase
MSPLSITSCYGPDNRAPGITYSGHLSNEPAITRLEGALLLEQNDEWQLQRRYLQLEGLLSLADNQPARLSAVVS